MHILRQIILCAVLSLSLESVVAQPSLVACDVIDVRTAETILSHPIKQHKPSRGSQTIGGAIVSNCIFFSDPGKNLRVTLAEYPTAAMARQEYTAGVQFNGYAKHKATSSLGDAASEWNAGTEASGYTVLKGPRVLLFDARGPGGDPTSALQRMRPFVNSAVKKM